jgi:hypothetical protein
MKLFMIIKNKVRIIKVFNIKNHKDIPQIFNNKKYHHYFNNKLKNNFLI